MAERRILLIVGGGIAAYKALELVRLARKAGLAVRPLLTRAGAEFVTPLSLGSLAEDKVYQELFSLTDEAEMGHIQLSRSAGLIVVAPATADLMAKAAHGLADDLASTTLLATDAAVLMAPAMNVRMWTHPATQANLATLKARGVRFVGPDEGAMACGEYGEGRLAEPPAILAAILAALEADPHTASWPTAAPTRPSAPASAPDGPRLDGKRVLVTAGPTREALDPVRYLSNHSSGKQGYAVAAALAGLGAEVTLVSGPTALAAPAGVRRLDVVSAREMLAACEASLPVDAAVLVAAVADWRPETEASDKLKKTRRKPAPVRMVENPDILATLAAPGARRPKLVVGFAAETQALEANARAKLKRKRCDWLLANDVSKAEVFGGDANAVSLVTRKGVTPWPETTKSAVAARLAAEIAKALT